MRRTRLAHSCDNTGRCSCAQWNSSLQLLRSVTVLQRLPLSAKRIALEKHTLSIMQSLPSRIPLLHVSGSLQHYSTAAKAPTKP